MQAYKWKERIWVVIMSPTLGKLGVHLHEVTPRGFLSHVVEYFEFVYEDKGSAPTIYCLVEKRHWLGSKGDWNLVTKKIAIVWQMSGTKEFVMFSWSTYISKAYQTRWNNYSIQANSWVHSLSLQLKGKGWECDIDANNIVVVSQSKPSCIGCVSSPSLMLVGWTSSMFISTWFAKTSPKM
jgi:hypothetical protein